MGFKIKTKRKSSTLRKRAKQFNTIDKEFVEVGHFSESGVHHSGMTYPELMALHHNGDPEVNLPARPVLSILAFRNKGLNHKDIRRAILNWGKRKHNRGSNEQLLADIGKTLVKEEKDIFGDPSVLIENANLTVQQKGRNEPLVDTGDLKEKTSYKTSTTKKVRST